MQKSSRYYDKGALSPTGRESFAASFPNQVTSRVELAGILCTQPDQSFKMMDGTRIRSVSIPVVSLILACVREGKCVVTTVAAIWVMCSRRTEARETRGSVSESTASVSST